MTIQKLYSLYKIMPSLQMHQYRVAAVGKTLCELYEIGDDATNIIAACLFHDMGNIIKFKLELFPDFLEPEGFDYWLKVKKEYHQQYGDDEHEATLKIVKQLFDDELRSSSRRKNKELRKERVIELIDAIGFSNAQYNYECDDIGRKIAAYADMRVEPYGVTTLAHRLEDGHKRFKLHKPFVSNEVFFNDMAQFLEKIEQQLFKSIEIKPSDITEESMKKYIPTLKAFEL